MKRNTLIGVTSAALFLTGSVASLSVGPEDTFVTTVCRAWPTGNEYRVSTPVGHLHLHRTLTRDTDDLARDYEQLQAGRVYRFRTRTTLWDTGVPNILSVQPASGLPSGCH